MWITAPDCFVSIAYQPAWCAPDELVVRARARGDLLAFGVADADVIATPQADYPYRANVQRSDVAAELIARATTMDYGNMKAKADRHRQRPYAGCWQSLLSLEDDQARPLPDRDPWTAAQEQPGVPWDQLDAEHGDDDGCQVCWQRPHAISCPVGNPSPTTEAHQ